MKLIQRMFVKQLLAIFIPCVVAVIFYVVTLSVQANSTHAVKEAERLDQTIVRMQLYNEIEQKIKASNVLLVDKIQLEAFNSSLEKWNTYLLVTSDSDIVFRSPILKDINRDYILTQYKQNEKAITIGRQTYDIHTIKLDDSTVNYLFLHEQTKKMAIMNTAFVVALIAFIISYIICCLYINYRLNRKLIKPIMQLKEAAVNISAGELDSIITVDTQDEIEELSSSLEFLRMKLKESISIQKKYDDNRSFLISSISHDLRTPVTTIKGYVEALRDGIASTPERKQHYLQIIDKKANQINEMIEDLLLYSKLDLNQLPFSFTKVNVVNYLQDGIEEYEQFFASKDVKMELTSYLSSPIYINIDSGRFMRVIQNIWNNAVLYNDKTEKLLSVYIRETFTSIVIEFKDNGKGLNKDEASQIFDRFYRSDRARQSDQGSGLGLAIAKQIVEAHQGSIWAKGEQGVGTSIYISLPKLKG